MDGKKKCKLVSRSIINVDTHCYECGDIDIPVFRDYTDWDYLTDDEIALLQKWVQKKNRHTYNNVIYTLYICHDDIPQLLAEYVAQCKDELQAEAEKKQKQKARNEKAAEKRKQKEIKEKKNLLQKLQKELGELQ